MRVVLFSLRAGQALPEHAANVLVTVYSVGGRVLFYEGTECCDMVPGTLIRLAPGRPHRLEAKEDSRLLVTVIKQPGDFDPGIGSSLRPQRRSKKGEGSSLLVTRRTAIRLTRSQRDRVIRG